jgi:hypothetical protein
MHPVHPCPSNVVRETFRHHQPSSLRRPMKLRDEVAGGFLFGETFLVIATRSSGGPTKRLNLSHSCSAIRLKRIRYRFVYDVHRMHQGVSKNRDPQDTVVGDHLPLSQIIELSANVLQFHWCFWTNSPASIQCQVLTCLTQAWDFGALFSFSCVNQQLGGLQQWTFSAQGPSLATKPWQRVEIKQVSVVAGCARDNHEMDMDRSCEVCHGISWAFFWQTRWHDNLW